MEEGKRKRLEEKLRQMIALQNQAQEDARPPKSPPPGTRAIRRRKGKPDKHIM